MMDQAILQLNKQFDFSPQIQNREKLSSYDKFLVCGMGGSHLAADILSDVYLDINLKVHSDYGLPNIENKENTLVILSSYSGNTEEVLDALKQALHNDLSVAIIATGGELIKIAQEKSLPYIQLPNTGVQPRSALGFSLVALLKVLQRDDLLEQVKLLSASLVPENWRQIGKDLARDLRGFVPIVYSSQINKSVAYNWKIKLNETGKIPAFYNIIPELNHNEMTGFDVKETSKELSDKFYFIFLIDNDDHPRIQKRFAILQKLYQDRNLRVIEKEMSGQTKIEKVFNSLILADWVAFYTAENYNLEAEQVPMVEEFKKLIKE